MPEAGDVRRVGTEWEVLLPVSDGGLDWFPLSELSPEELGEGITGISIDPTVPELLIQDSQGQWTNLEGRPAAPGGFGVLPPDGAAPKGIQDLKPRWWDDRMEARGPWAKMGLTEEVGKGGKKTGKLVFDATKFNHDLATAVSTAKLLGIDTEDPTSGTLKQQIERALASGDVAKARELQGRQDALDQPDKPPPLRFGTIPEAQEEAVAAEQATGVPWQVISTTGGFFSIVRSPEPDVPASRSLNQEIDRLLLEGDFDRALQLDEWRDLLAVDRPQAFTDALDRALDAAQTPGDYLTLFSLLRGRIPVEEGTVPVAGAPGFRALRPSRLPGLLGEVAGGFGKPAKVRGRFGEMPALSPDGGERTVPEMLLGPFTPPQQRGEGVLPSVRANGAGIRGQLPLERQFEREGALRQEIARGEALEIFGEEPETFAPPVDTGSAIPPRGTEEGLLPSRVQGGFSAKPGLPPKAALAETFFPAFQTVLMEGGVLPEVPAQSISEITRGLKQPSAQAILRMTPSERAAALAKLQLPGELGGFGLPREEAEAFFFGGAPAQQWRTEIFTAPRIRRR